MAIRSLLNLSCRRSHAVAATSSPPLPLSSSSTTMRYDRIADNVKSKLKRLETPDSRFLRYTCPHPVHADHTAILSSPETRVTTLPNGLRVATESRLPSPVAAVGVWIDSGSRFESEATNGVAHFLERMVFKGTEKRPGRVLMEEIGSIGGQLSARTSREHTTYCAEVMAEEVPKALDVLSDMLQNACFPEDQMELERDLILQRIKEEVGRSEEVIFDHLHATAFQHTPLGRTIMGHAQNIKTINKSNIKDHISAHYAAHRMVIAATGAVKHEDIVEQVKKTFTKLSANPYTTRQLVAEKPAIFTGSEVRIIDDDLPLAHFAVAFNGASWTDTDSIALMVITSMLGSWNKNAGGGQHMGSQLVQRVAINEIAECMAAFNTNYKDTGLFGVYAVAKASDLNHNLLINPMDSTIGKWQVRCMSQLKGEFYFKFWRLQKKTINNADPPSPTTPDCLDDLAYAIMLEMSKLPYRVSEKDVIRARNQLKSSLLFRMNGLSPVVEDIGRQLFTYGRRIPLAELFARIDAVDADTIKRVANRFIFDRDIAIAAMGPIQGLPDYNWFRRRTYLLRY